MREYRREHQAGGPGFTRAPTDQELSSGRGDGGYRLLDEPSVPWTCVQYSLANVVEAVD